jgi:hypothetical protein
VLNAVVAGGAVEKTTLLGAAGAMAMAELVTVPPDVVSAAVKVHEPAPSMMTLLNVAVLFAVASIFVPDPSGHDSSS